MQGTAVQTLYGLGFLPQAPTASSRAVLTSSRHPLVAVVPPPGLGTPGRGFTAWYLSVFFYVFTFSQCLDESEHMIGNENAIEAALVLFS